MAEQLSNVGDAVLDHGWPLQAQAPRDHAHVLPKKNRTRMARAVDETSEDLQKTYST